jgi:hypothetical protein
MITAIAVLIALWLGLLLWIVFRKLRRTQVKLELQSVNTHKHKAAKLEFFGPRLNVLCMCNKLMATYMCIPVGPEGDVYGPETEKITGTHSPRGRSA